LGQKVHPYGFRLGINRTWRSRWFARKDYGALLLEDLNLKLMLKKKFFHAGISHIEIERAANKLTIIIFTARPGIIVGKKGSEIEKLKKDLQTLTGRDVNLKIQEVNKPELDESFIAAAKKQGIVSIKGHKMVGGMRASIYNAMPLEGVQALVSFMQDFERQHG